MTETGKPSELDRLAEENSVAYENNMALRALVLMIPGIGSSLDLVLADGGQRYRERILSALEDMKEDMKERLGTVEESALDKEFLNSDEFFDLMMKFFDTTTKSRDETKRRLGARILTESMILSDKEQYSPEEYLDLIADLTPRELAVAQALYKEQVEQAYENLEASEVRQAWKAWQDSVRTEASIEGADLQLILGRLQSLGLIVEDSALYPSDGGPPNSERPLYSRLYWTSPAFKKLMRFLNRRE